MLWFGLFSCKSIFEKKTANNPRRACVYISVLSAVVWSLSLTMFETSTIHFPVDISFSFICSTASNFSAFWSVCFFSCLAIPRHTFCLFSVVRQFVC
jgi:hypothetical protein